MTAPIARKLYHFNVDLFAKLQHPANFVAFTRGESFGKYRRLTKQAERTLEHEDLTGVALSHVPPQATDPTQLELLSASAGLSQFKFNGRIEFVDLDAITSMVVPAVTAIYPGTYGYGYILDAAYGPGFHAVGMLYMCWPDRDKVPSLPRDEEKRCSRWFPSDQRNEALAKGLLRDVYPMNYLTDVHTRHKIDGQRLFDWIEHDTARGTLAKIRPGAWLWRVAEDRCMELGERLQAAGLLI
jgi:hypothetical protein